MLTTLPYRELWRESLRLSVGWKNQLFSEHVTGLDGANRMGSGEKHSFNSADSSLLVGVAKSVWSGSKSLVTIQIEVSVKLRERMKQHGIAHLEAVFITDSDIRHIMKRHARREEKRGQLPIEPSDFSFIPAVLSDFDSCEESSADKHGNKRFLLSKRVGDLYYVVTVQRGKKRLEVKTMWKKPGASC